MDFFYDYDIDHDKAEPKPSNGHGMSAEEDNKFSKLINELSQVSIEDSLEASEAHISKHDILKEKLSKILNRNYKDNDHDIKNGFRSLQNTDYLNLESTTGQDYKSAIQLGILGKVSRDKLKNNVENRSLYEKTQVLDSLKSTYETVVGLKISIGELNATNDLLKTELEQLTQFNNKNFKHNEKFNLAQLKELKVQKDKILVRKSILEQFRAQYQLNEYEKYLLESSKDINWDFFDSLKKANKIHDSCDILLSLNNPKIGLNIMKQMKFLIDQAFNNMNFYISKQMERLGDLKKQDYDIMQKCISIIVTQEAKQGSDGLYGDSFNTMIKNLTELRSNEILKDFNQLVKNNESQIYTSNLDPLRYIGDLLASIYSIIVGEKEIIDLLFEESHGQLQTRLLNNIINALSNPIKLRLESVVRNQEDISTISQMFNSLDLYQLMYTKQLVDKDSLIIGGLMKLKELSQERIFTILHNKFSLVNTEKLNSTDDLQPPDWLIDYLFSINGILKGLAVIGDGSFMQFSDEAIVRLVNLMIDRPLELVHQCIDSSGIPADCKKIFLINCLELVSSKLLPINQVSFKYQEVNQTQIDETYKLIDIEYHYYLAESGLAQVEAAINSELPIDTFLETNPSYQVYDSVKSQLSDGLVNATNLSLEPFITDFSSLANIVNLSQVSSPVTSNEIIESSCLRFVNFYKIFHSLTVLYVPETHLLWNDIEVATLLGVEKAYFSVIEPSRESEDSRVLDYTG